jgi:hypothetical protein
MHKRVVNGGHLVCLGDTQEPWMVQKLVNFSTTTLAFENVWQGRFLNGVLVCLGDTQDPWK